MVEFHAPPLINTQIYKTRVVPFCGEHIFLWFGQKITFVKALPM